MMHKKRSDPVDPLGSVCRSVLGSQCLSIGELGNAMVMEASDLRDIPCIGQIPPSHYHPAQWHLQNTIYGFARLFCQV